MLKQIKASAFATLLLFTFLNSLGCAGVKFDEARAKRVKRMAIISFEIQQARPTDNLGIARAGELKNGVPGDSPELQAMAKNIFSDLNTQLKKKTGWNTLTFDEISANRKYESKVKQAMEGARLTSMVADGYELISLHGLLDIYAFRKLNYDQQVKLAKDLGVDAFAEVTIYQAKDQSWMSLGHLSGDAAFSYRTRMNLWVYGLDSPEPIWRIQNVDGEMSPDSDTLPKQTSRLERRAQIGQLSAKSAVLNLVQEYQRK